MLHADLDCHPIEAMMQHSPPRFSLWEALEEESNVPEAEKLVRTATNRSLLISKTLQGLSITEKMASFPHERAPIIRSIFKRAAPWAISAPSFLGGVEIAIAEKEALLSATQLQTDDSGQAASEPGRSRKKAAFPALGKEYEFSFTCGSFSARELKALSEERIAEAPPALAARVKPTVTSDTIIVSRATQTSNNTTSSPASSDIIMADAGDQQHSSGSSGSSTRQPPPALTKGPKDSTTTTGFGPATATAAPVEMRNDEDFCIETRFGLVIDRHPAAAPQPNDNTSDAVQQQEHQHQHQHQQGAVVTEVRIAQDAEATDAYDDTDDEAPGFDETSYRVFVSLHRTAPPSCEIQDEDGEPVWWWPRHSEEEGTNNTNNNGYNDDDYHDVEAAFTSAIATTTTTSNTETTTDTQMSNNLHSSFHPTLRSFKTWASRPLTGQYGTDRFKTQGLLFALALALHPGVAKVTYGMPGPRPNTYVISTRTRMREGTGTGTAATADPDDVLLLPAAVLERFEGDLAAAERRAVEAERRRARGEAVRGLLEG